MVQFDYTQRGRRPSAVQIVADWKKAERPGTFEVTYGETYAEFHRLDIGRWTASGGRWTASGNGCEGVKRDEVVKLLLAADAAPGGERWL